MKTTTLILSAIIAALPLAANATQTIVTTQTPAAVGSDGTVKKAATSGPYVTIEPSPADQTHIATTAYVKGAYNDAIAAVNKVSEEVILLTEDVFGEIDDRITNLYSNIEEDFATNTALNSKRVRIYTTWDDDTAAATTLVPFETAQ